MSAATAGTGACPYVVGEDLARFSDEQARAWLGLLHAHRALTRELDAALDARYGLSLSGLEVLGRLAEQPDRQQRLTQLATASGLTLSRVSRLIGDLERRGLVERRPCPEDARAINAWLTDAGRALAREAQASHAADVQRRVFDRLDDEHLRALGEAFELLVPFTV
jgi:DNA-binding MarR family transcriptional regulator